MMYHSLMKSPDFRGRGGKLVALLVAATAAATLPCAFAEAGSSCIVSGTVDRSAQFETTQTNCTDINTFAAPEIRIDGLNLRSDEVHGALIIFR